METTKEVKVVESKVDGALKAATAMSKNIKSDIIYEDASVMLQDIRKVENLVKQEKKKQLDPANETVKAIRSFWKPFEERCGEAVDILKPAVLKYKQSIDARNAKKEATISKSVEEGDTSFEKGVEEIEKKHTKATHAEIKTRKIKKVRFVSLTSFNAEDLAQLIVDGYIVWDEVKVRREAIQGANIAGVEVYEEEIIG